MKKFVFVLLLILIMGLCFAQEDFGIPSVIPKELIDGHFEMLAPSSARFLVDVIDTINVVHGHPVLPLNYKVVNISTDGQATWTSYDLSLLTEDTYYYDYTAPVTGEYVHYYFQIGTDSTFTSQAPINTAASFPPPTSRMANIHDDPVGDQLPVNVGGTDYAWNNTDLVNFKMGYSENNIYTQMTTNGGYNTSHDDIYLRTCGSWPFEYDQTVDVFHLYAHPIVNPEAEYLDSIFYAVIYGDMDITFLGIGITITPGVYKIIKPGEDAGISDYLSAYTKISNSSTFGYNISGDVLDMWFSLSLLTSDPDFGPLPDDNLIYTGAGIASAYMMQSSCSEVFPDTFAYVVNDFSNNTGFYLTTLSGEVLQVEEDKPAKPEEVSLSAHPNPFNSSVTITAPAGAEVEVFDANGRLVSVISMRAVPEEKSPTNPQEISRQARNDNEKSVVWQPDETIGSGVYLIRAKTGGGETATNKIIYLK